MFDLIHITAQYSNAVLLAVLPYVSDFAQKLELPIPLPITTNTVKVFYPFRTTGAGDAGGHLTTTNGYHFRFWCGNVQEFYSSRNSMAIGDSDPSPESFYGPVNITLKQAIELARTTVGKLGYDLNVLGLDRPPVNISGPYKYPEKKKTVPFYELTWEYYTDLGRERVVKVCVDGENKQVTRIAFLCDATQRRDFDFGIPYETESEYQRRMHPETQKPIKPPDPKVAQYSNDVLLAVLPHISEFARRMELPIALPLSTHSVESFRPAPPTHPGGGGFLTTTNRFEFAFSFGNVQAYYSRRYCLMMGVIKDPQPQEKIVGPVKISVAQAVELAQTTVKKLGYDLRQLRMNRRPDKVDRPKKLPYSDKKIPFCGLRWEWKSKDGSEQAVEMEVDCENAQVIRIDFLCDETKRKDFDLGVPGEAKSAFHK